MQRCGRRIDAPLFSRPTRDRRPDSSRAARSVALADAARQHANSAALRRAGGQRARASASSSNEPPRGDKRKRGVARQVAAAPRLGEGRNRARVVQDRIGADRDRRSGGAGARRRAAWRQRRPGCRSGRRASPRRGRRARRRCGRRSFKRRRSRSDQSATALASPATSTRREEPQRVVDQQRRLRMGEQVGAHQPQRPTGDNAPLPPAGRARRASLRAASRRFAAVSPASRRRSSQRTRRGPRQVNVIGCAAARCCWSSTLSPTRGAAGAGRRTLPSRSAPRSPAVRRRNAARRGRSAQPGAACGARPDDAHRAAPRLRSRRRRTAGRKRGATQSGSSRRRRRTRRAEGHRGGLLQTLAQQTPGAATRERTACRRRPAPSGAAHRSFARRGGPGLRRSRPDGASSGG